MGYWSTVPMGGDYPLDVQDKLREELTIEFSPNEVIDSFLEYNNSNSFSDFELYDCMISSFIKWIRQCAIYEEEKLICFLKGFYNKQSEDIKFVIPLSFLEWGVKIGFNSKLSKVLLEMLINTDEGNKYRGYTVEENLYPNKLYTPCDFIKYYIDNWNSLIEGKINYNKIQSDLDNIPTLGKNIINVK